MARIDWLAMQEEFTAEHAASGISVKEWCEKQGLNYQSARRHIKFRTAHSDVRNAQSAQSKVRTIAHSEKNAQPKGNEGKAKRGEGRERKSSSSTQRLVDRGQNPNTNGRDCGGRFMDGNSGNPNPPISGAPATGQH